MRGVLRAGRRARTTAALVGLAVALALVGACSSDDPAEEDAADAGRADREVIARTVLQVGDPDLVLEPRLLQDHLVVLFQVNGRLSTTEAECAAQRFSAELGDDTRRPLAEVLSADTRPDRRAAVDACTDTPSGPETPVDPFETTVPEPLPDDVDPDALRTHLVELTAAVASSLGMTPEEAACFGEQAYGTLDDAQIVATLEPAAAPEVELPERTGADEVAACLTDERVSTLVEELRPVLEAHERAAQEADEPLSVGPGG